MTLGHIAMSVLVGIFFARLGMAIERILKDD